MKIAVISDIHANATAFESVLRALDEEAPDRILCAGDVVGYGPHPRQCIEMVRQRGIPCVLGNHDEYTSQIGMQDLWQIREEAKTSIVWSQSMLSDHHIQWLRNLPRMIDVEGIQIVHGSHALWPPWRYVTNSAKAAQNFLFQGRQIAFNGHTHVPLLAMHRRGLPAQVIPLTSCRLPRNEASRVLVGVGSVGQPRDGDCRASFVLLDTEKSTLRLRRVEYDVAEVQNDIQAAGLPGKLAQRLSAGR